MSNTAIFENALNISDLNVEVLPPNGLDGGLILKGFLHDVIDFFVPNPHHY